MREFFERKHVPKWRLVLYGVLATTIIASLGFYLNDSNLIIASVIFGIFIVGFGFVLDAARTNTNLRDHKIVRWLLYIGVLTVVVQKGVSIFW